MLIKRHRRNLYRASSVMIYMQMSQNVLSIYYGGFSDFIQSMLIMEKEIHACRCRGEPGASVLGHC